MSQPKQTPKEKKNTKDATKMEKMRAVFKGPGSKLPQPKPSYVGGSPAKNGKTMKKAKAGFDLNKDGKTTFKDVLIGRGVLPKTAKSGASMKKAKSGASMKKCRGGCK